ncbi:MAG: DUF4430 domain-containing protein [Solirubrobacteraceae bacterium]|nr:DUF4430 domain-containing protein [Solirubrobacteraceae bacterium]
MTPTSLHRARARRAIVAAIAVFAVLPTAAEAAKITATVRVEGQNATLLAPTKVVLDTEEVAAFSPTGAAAYTCAGSSATAALQAATGGNWDQRQFVQTILGELHNFSANDYWNVAKNNVSSNVGACEELLSDGDTVLFQATTAPPPNYDSQSSYVSTTGVPSVVLAGKAFTTTTNVFTSGVAAPAGDFTLVAGTQEIDIANDGTAAVTFPTVGRFDVQAKKLPAGTDWGRSELRTVCVETVTDRCRQLAADAQAKDLGAQPAGTIGAPVTVTYTAGRIAIDASRVWVEGANAPDFLVSGETCTAAAVASASTCTVQVRFAPTAASARTATLKVRSDAHVGDTSVALTGTGTSAPVGVAGPAGADGTNGANGANGAVGPQGPLGPIGPAGPQGVPGAPGQNGADGKDGVVTLQTSRGTTSVRAGRTAQLKFKLTNATLATLSKTSAVAITPRSLAVSGKGEAVVHSIGAGDERTTTLALRIARNAKRGTYDVKIRVRLGDRSISSVVELRVR